MTPTRAIRSFVLIATTLTVLAAAVPDAFAIAGTLDGTFSGDGKQTADFFGSDDNGNAVAVQDDGSVVVAGTVSNGGQNDFGVVRFTSAGMPDGGFGSGGLATTDFGANDQAYAVAIQGDGKIVVAGYRLTLSGTSKFAVARYETDGTPDTAFSGDGKVTTSVGTQSGAYAVAVDGNGSVVAGGFSGTDFAAVRYDTFGVLDPTFSADGKKVIDIGPNDAAFALAPSPVDDTIVLAGNAITNDATHARFGLARLTSAGQLDTTFSGDGKLRTSFGASYDATAYGVVVQADGAIVAAGWVSSGGGNFALARYDTTGTLDGTFGTGGKATFGFGGADTAHAVALQGDQKILVAGGTDATGDFDFAVVRLTTGGVLDTSFSGDGKVRTNFTTDDVARAVAVSPVDGKILVAGDTTDFSNYDFAVARYLAA